MNEHEFTRIQANHFFQVGKMVKFGSGSEREIENYQLSRYACYLIVQNGYPSKLVIANGQSYSRVLGGGEMSEYALMPMENLQKMIFTIRGVQVMVDRDLSTVYEVETKVLNQAVKRNAERFPQEFRFQLTDAEKEELVTNCDRFESLKHSTSNPHVFTEQGVSMLSAVLRSETAIKVSIQIINAFVDMRKFIQYNASVFARLDSVERRQIVFESETEKNFEKVLLALEAGEIPKQGIFYDGQVYDAYSFVADLIRTAKRSLILIDNYVDDSVLTMLGKRRNGVRAFIYTKKITKQLALDLKKHNEQYPVIRMETFEDAHDRFLIVDENEIYHIGASLKDLGKKWFAFSRLEKGTMKMLQKLRSK